MPALIVFCFACIILALGLFGWSFYLMWKDDQEFDDLMRLMRTKNANVCKQEEQDDN